jgi:hypothetical protein
MSMRSLFRLFVIVAKAALIVTAGSFALVLTAVSFGLKSMQRPAAGEILVAAASAFIPAGVAIWWMFPKLRTVYPRREARAVSTAFALFTPISLVVALVLAQIPGGYAQSLIGPQFFGLVGALLGTVVMTGFLSFLVCALVLRVTQLIIRVEQNN